MPNPPYYRIERALSRRCRLCGALFEGQAWGAEFNGRFGLIAVADDLSKVPEIRAKGASHDERAAAF